MSKKIMRTYTFLMRIDDFCQQEQTVILEGESPEDALLRAGYNPKGISWVLLTVKDVEDNI